jgi:hypothetical protein
MSLDPMGHYHSPAKRNQAMNVARIRYGATTPAALNEVIIGHLGTHGLERSTINAVQAHCREHLENRR